MKRYGKVGARADPCYTSRTRSSTADGVPANGDSRYNRVSGGPVIGGHNRETGTLTTGLGRLNKAENWPPSLYRLLLCPTAKTSPNHYQSVEAEVTSLHDDNDIGNDVKLVMKCEQMEGENDEPTTQRWRPTTNGNGTRCIDGGYTDHAVEHRNAVNSRDSRMYIAEATPELLKTDARGCRETDESLYSAAQLVVSAAADNIPVRPLDGESQASRRWHQQQQPPAYGAEGPVAADCDDGRSASGRFKIGMETMDEDRSTPLGISRSRQTTGGDTLTSCTRALSPLTNGVGGRVTLTASERFHMRSMSRLSALISERSHGRDAAPDIGRDDIDSPRPLYPRLAKDDVEMRMYRMSPNGDLNGGDSSRTCDDGFPAFEAVPEERTRATEDDSRQRLPRKRFRYDKFLLDDESTSNSIDGHAAGNGFQPRGASLPMPLEGDQPLDCRQKQKTVIAVRRDGASPFQTPSNSWRPQSKPRDTAAMLTGRGSTDAASGAWCVPCGIWFSDQVLYSIHAGCHTVTGNSSDAFSCNVCGRSCADRYAFNTHLVRGHTALNVEQDEINGIPRHRPPLAADQDWQQPDDWTRNQPSRIETSPLRELIEYRQCRQ